MGKKKNSFLKKLALIMILVFVVALGIVSCTFLENKTLSVPKSIIQGKVDKKFPITKNFLFAKVTLKNPKVDFKGDKMYIDADYSASLLEVELVEKCIWVQMSDMIQIKKNYI